jgi:hypothetical protein
MVSRLEVYLDFGPVLARANEVREILKAGPLEK